MDEFLEKKLFEIDPVFLREKDMDMTETCMCWGFECGDGWFESLKMLLEGTKEINNILKDKNARIVAKQIKEKWGILTIYYDIEKIDPEKDDIDCEEEISRFEELLNKVQSDASERCEFCGEKKELFQTIGWINYICEDCAIKFNKKYKHINKFENKWKEITPDEFFNELMNLYKD